MSARRLPAALVLLGLAGPLAAAERAGPAEVRAALARALPLIEKGSAGHLARRTCFACHHEAVPVLALTAARSRGLAVDEELVRKHLRHTAEFLDGNRENYRQGRGQGGQVDTAGYALWTLDLAGWGPDATTAAVAEYLLLHNRGLDHWRTTSNRPPSEVSPFTTTFVAVRGLQAFGTPEQRERAARRLRAARGWLAQAPPGDTEDRVFRLWALARLGCPDKEVQAAARELLRTQRPGGGWAQRDGMAADAYATGTALVALHEAAGLPADAPAYRRGVAFLLARQLPDGSWHVRSRSRPFQTYFESGFPHGKDQFISLAASSWAVTALALSLPPAGPAGAAAPRPPALKLVQTIPLKGPAGRLDHLALDGRHGRLFVANMANASLDVVDLKAGRLVKQIPGQKGIQGIAYAPDLDRVFVGNEAGGLFHVFDGRDYRLLKTIEFADDADNVRYDPRRRLVYVAHAEKSLAVVDARSLEVRADVKLPGQPEAFQLETARPRLYLNTPATREVVVIDADGRKVVAHYPLRSAGGNYPLALDEAGRRLFVGCRKPPAVVVLDSESGKEVARAAIPGDTDDLFFDAGRRVLYASCGEGFLAVIRQGGKDRYERLEKIATVRGARTSLFDPEAGRLYLAVPRQQGKEGPEVRVYQAR